MTHGQMRVIEVAEPGGPDMLVLQTRTIPAPGHKQILIKNAAAGVNRPDILQRAGLYNPPPNASNLLGLESAGEVVAVGDSVTGWKVNDCVTALLPGGGYAEYSLTHEDHALPVPKDMDMKSAAALCETFFTVYSNIFTRGQLRAGETFLVHGGSSGIGTTAIQLAAVMGATVYATAGSTKKCQTCEQLGAQLGINYHQADFVKVIREATDGRGVDVILDMVGGDYITRNLRCLADDGRLIQIAFLKGPKVKLNFVHLMMRRLTITGSTLRSQSDLAKADIARKLRHHVWPLLDSGRIAPVMDSSFRLEEATLAHQRIETSKHIGKIVLTM